MNYVKVTSLVANRYDIYQTKPNTYFFLFATIPTDNVKNAEHFSTVSKTFAKKKYLPTTKPLVPHLNTAACNAPMHSTLFKQLVQNRFANSKNFIE